MNMNLEVLLRTFGDIPEIVESYFKNIPELFLDKEYQNATWTIRKHFYHILTVQELLYQRMIKIRDEQNPVITPYFPENEKSVTELFKSLDEAFSYYKEMRNKQISLIKSLSEADFNKDAQHGEYIKYNIPIIINHIIFHEYWHLYRIEELWLTREDIINE